MTTRIASTIESSAAPGPAIDSHDDRGSRHGRAGLFVAVTLMVAVAVIAVVSSISTNRRGDERRRVEFAEVVGRYDVAVTNHDWVALESLLAPTFVFHDVEYGSLQDGAGFLAWAATIGNSYSDFRISFGDVQRDGEVATVFFHESESDASGTRTTAATGVTGVVRMRVVAHAIVEMWSNYDEFGLIHDRARTVVG